MLGRRLPLLLTVVLALSACSLEASILLTEDGALTEDGGRGDSGREDAGTDSGAADSAVDSAADTTPPDTGTTTMDTGVPDSGQPDTGLPDTGAPDTGAPDTGAPDTGTPRPNCNQLFGTLRFYERCEQTPDACEFYADEESEVTCDALCATAGQTCLGSWSEGSSGDRCNRGSGRACNNAGNDFLCRCTRP